MAHQNNSKWIAILAVSILALAGCQLGNANGYVPTSAQISQIQIGVDNKATIEERFGRPTVVGETQSVWYYIASERVYPGPLPTNEVKRRILAIAFNGDVVASVREEGLNAAADIAVTNQATPTGGTTLSFWDQIRGSIGNFSAEEFLK